MEEYHSEGDSTDVGPMTLSSLRASVQDTVIIQRFEFGLSKLNETMKAVIRTGELLGQNAVLLDQTIAFLSSKVVDDIEKAYAPYIAHASSKYNESLELSATSGADVTSESMEGPDMLFNQQLFRTSSHPHFNNPGRRDGLLSYTRTQIACQPAFDFVYRYTAAHDNSLSQSHFARRTPISADICDGYTYTDLDDYMSYYVYEQPQQASSSLGRFNRVARYGNQSGYPAGTLIDRVYYNYTDPNRPSRVTKAGEYYAHRIKGYRTGYRFNNSSNLSYLSSGQLTYAAEGRQRLNYGQYLAKPSSIVVSGSTTTNYYMESGSFAGYNTAGSTHNFTASTEYVNDVPHRYIIEDGYYDYTMNRWVFQLTDYLGTPRVIFTDVNQDGKIRAADDILEEQTLYPYGQYAFGSSNANGVGYSSDMKDFTGHYMRGGESDRIHGLHDMQARYYVAGLGIFGGVDPLSSSFPSYTPYHYVHNNPINLIDPTGMSADNIIIELRDENDKVRASIDYNNDGTATYASGANKGKAYEGGNSFFDSTLETLSDVRSADGRLDGMVEHLENSTATHVLTNDVQGMADNGSKNASTGGPGSRNTVTQLQSGRDAKNNSGDASTTPNAVATHELKHAYNRDTGRNSSANSGRGASGVRREEVDAVNTANIYRAARGLPPKTTYTRRDISRELVPNLLYDPLKK